MHFPDSVLSPSTAIVTGAAMLPVWAVAARRVRKTLGTRQIPLLSLGAAFCFTIMLFNIPALGGTTAHPVAGTLLAVLLGPWAAVIGISVALGIQALFFGDGGLLAFGANCFAMAFALPFVGYTIYNALARLFPSNPAARAICAGFGAYFGINAAAAIVAVLLGIQPAYFHESNGQPLYFPFGIKVTLPAMLGTHLLIAGPAEAIVTALVVRIAQQMGLPLYGIEGTGNRDNLTPNTQHLNIRTPEYSTTGHRPPTTRYEPLWIGLLACLALSPLGLIAQGDAWGEWDAEGTRAQIQQMEGRDYVPQGLAKADETGHKGIRGLEDYASEKGPVGYILAGTLGAGAIAALMLVGGRFLAGRHDDTDRSQGGGDSNSGQKKPGGDSGGSEGETMLPDWMLRPSEEAPPDVSGRPSNPFLERTLSELAANAAATLQTDRFARQNGYLQRLDPRAKLLAFVALIAVVATVRNLATLCVLIALTLLLAGASKLPLGVFIRRVWLAVPLFVGVVTLPAVLNLVTPGRVVVLLWQEPAITITDTGLLVALTLTLRAGVAISCAALLTLTTGWNDLLRALRTFFVPRLFVSVLAMTYRYLAVLLLTTAEMWMARNSRAVGRVANQEGRRFAAFSVGALFGKSLALADEVHGAMESRGFRGEMHTLTRMQWRRADSAWMLGMALVAVLAFQIR